MNNPISVGIGKYDVLYGLDKTLEMIKKAGFEYVDFWLCHYCEKLDAPMRQDDWREWTVSIREKFDSYGLKIGQVHAHWRFKDEINEDFSYKQPWRVIYRNFEAATILGTDKLVFHPMQRWLPVSDKETLDKVIECNAGFYSALVDEAEKWNCYIDIENLFDHKHKCAPNSPAFPFSRPEHLLKLADLIGSDRVGFCLDTGHANIAGVDNVEMIRALGPRLNALHLNDNYGLIGPIYEDVHLFPGYGRIEWKPVFEALKEIGYKGTLNMEVNNETHRQSVDSAAIMLRAARELLEYMRDNY